MMSDSIRRGGSPGYPGTRRQRPRTAICNLVNFVIYLTVLFIDRNPCYITERTSLLAVF